MIDLTPLRLPRPHRADAARNYDAILEAARETFAEQGADVALEEIARRAGVGIATLYRNFPTREQLIENVYIAEVEAVCRTAEESADLDPWEGLSVWLHRFVEYIGAKRPLAAGLNRESATYDACRQALYQAGGPLLDRAQASGQVRPDVTIDDVMRLASGIAGVDFATAAQREHVLSVALDGLGVLPVPSGHGSGSPNSSLGSN
ncbi:TetR family transcriptional regulator [Kribbella amoyensis]|uniref:TetR family transcriptional regulator n=1 Tax=Kribbella amoyensis TaxID=996641 RepID=A0A561BTU5_9ACTN|nr:TetR/AcrR family transcriptional regulator [Kribbella amoyensis]TWD82295.1 TetR family transcriptional regulator [Kribbella amoyensis]